LDNVEWPENLACADIMYPDDYCEMIFLGDLPLSPGELDAVSAIASESGAWVTGIDLLEDVPWQMIAREQAIYPPGFLAHLDTSFVSHLLKLVDGRPFRMTANHRTVAALMALSITFGFKLNPTCASHEYACTGADSPEERLLRFRYADKLHPQLYADVALGRKESLPPPSAEELKPYRGNLEPIGKLEVQGFSLNYLAVLSALDIHTDPKYGKHDRKGRMARTLAFVEWIHSDGIMMSCYIYAAQALWGPENHGIKIIKKANSADPDILLRHARNAAWDLTILCVWSNLEGARDTEGQREPIHLLYTLDRSLAHLARFLFFCPLNSDRERMQLETAKVFWPEREAREVCQKRREIERRRHEPSRRSNQRDWSSTVPAMVEELESKLRQRLST